MSKKSGEMVRDSKGRFVKGVGGNPAGRPTGSKNRVTLLKVISEEQFREEAAEKVNQVLHLILNQALEGDKPSQKLIWDSHVSKANLTEDKSAGAKQQITIHRMEVSKDGDIIDMKPIEEEDEQRSESDPHGPVSTH